MRTTHRPASAHVQICEHGARTQADDQGKDGQPRRATGRDQPDERTTTQGCGKHRQGHCHHVLPLAADLRHSKYRGAADEPGQKDHVCGARQHDVLVRHWFPLPCCWRTHAVECRLVVCRVVSAVVGERRPAQPRPRVTPLRGTAALARGVEHHQCRDRPHAVFQPEGSPPHPAKFGGRREAGHQCPKQRQGRVGPVEPTTQCRGEYGVCDNTGAKPDQEPLCPWRRGHASVREERSRLRIFVVVHPSTQNLVEVTPCLGRSRARIALRHVPRRGAQCHWHVGLVLTPGVGRLHTWTLCNHDRVS